MTRVQLTWPWWGHRINGLWFSVGTLCRGATVMSIAASGGRKVGLEAVKDLVGHQWGKLE